MHPSSTANSPPKPRQNTTFAAPTHQRQRRTAPQRRRRPRQPQNPLDRHAGNCRLSARNSILWYPKSMGWDVVHLVAGTTGGLVSSFVLHPLDLVKVRFQVRTRETPVLSGCKIRAGGRWPCAVRPQRHPPLSVCATGVCRCWTCPASPRCRPSGKSSATKASLDCTKASPRVRVVRCDVGSAAAPGCCFPKPATVRGCGQCTCMGLRCGKAAPWAMCEWLDGRVWGWRPLWGCVHCAVMCVSVCC